MLTYGPVQDPRPPASKRPRSLVACGACRKRRSKCEPCLDDDPHGHGGQTDQCLRCRQLRTECSFLPGTGRSRRVRWSENSPPLPLPHGSATRHQHHGAMDHMDWAAHWDGADDAPPPPPVLTNPAPSVFTSGPLSHSTVSPLAPPSAPTPSEPMETASLRQQVEQLQREIHVLRAQVCDPSALP